MLKVSPDIRTNLNSLLILFIFALCCSTLIVKGQTTIINEELRDGVLPSGWGGIQIDFRTTTDGYALFEESTSLLTTPSFNASIYDSIEIIGHVAKFGSGSDGPITVEYSLNGGSNWDTAGISPVPTSSAYLPFNVYVDTTSSNMQIRFSRGSSPSQKRLRDIEIIGFAENPPATFNSNMIYRQDFADFNDASSLPLGWNVSDSTYDGDWGSGSSIGLRGNNYVLGYQHTGSSGLFIATLSVFNSTGMTLDSIRVHYTGAVERETQGRSPEWTVKIDGVTQGDLSYSTSSGKNKVISAVITGINIVPGQIFEISWESDRGQVSTGSSKQIGIKNVVIQPGDRPQAGWRITDQDVLFEIDFDQTVSGVNEGAFNGTGISPTPANGQLNSGAWKISGLGTTTSDFFQEITSGVFALGVSNGGEITGGLYSFETSTNNFAPGVQPAGSNWLPGSFVLRVLNETESTINTVLAAYEVLIYNDENRSNSFNFSYSLDGANYTDLPLLDFTSIGPAAGSVEWETNERTLSLNGLNWQDGEYLYLRWSGDDVSGSNSRDEFALDNIRFIAEPSSNSITSVSGSYESVALQTSQTLTGDLDISRYLRTAAGAELEIASGNNLHVTGSIENNGTITVKNNGSLTQEGGSDQNTNNGTYTIEREGTANTMAYNGWSSPVAGVWLHDNSGVFSSANACDVFVFDATSQTWKYDFPTTYSPDCGTGPVNFTSNVVISGADGIANTARGYFAPGGGSATRIFSGQAVHNADISISAQAGTGSTGSNWTGNNWNLIGNPYPSSINIEDFISANSSALNTETIYVWDDDQSGNPGSSTDYIAINNIGTTSSPGGSSNSITDYLASCQGFFIQSDGTQTINFTNAMREKGNNNQFRSDDDKPSRFWLQLSTDSAASEMLFGVIADAAIDFDKKYDAPKRYAHQNLNLSGQLPDGEEMMIMGVPKPLFDRPFSIPLTVQSNTQNTVTFNISQNQLYEDNLNIALIDKSLNDTAFMLEETYTTALDSAGKTADRFELLFFIKGSLGDTGTSIAKLKNNEFVKIYTAPGQITLESAGSRITSIYISDISGRTVWSEPDTRGTVKQISTANWKPGVYIIRTNTENGETETRKLFLN